MSNRFLFYFFGVFFMCFVVIILLCFCFFNYGKRNEKKNQIKKALKVNEWKNILLYIVG